MIANSRLLRFVVNLLAVIVLLLLVTSYIFQDVLDVFRSGIKDLEGVLLMGMVMVFFLLISLAGVYIRVKGIVQQYTKALYKLDDQHASDMIDGIMYQIPRKHRARMTLKVKDGHLDPEVAQTVKRVGGPGYVNIDAEHFVVTSRFGILYRTLEAGMHPLDPFEKIWDVIDLRPQYREITVDFTTSEGIPVQCKANILFRIAHPKVFNAFRLATSKFVKSASGRNRLADWTNGIVNGTLDGAVRDLLEYFELDRFVNPSQNFNQGAFAQSHVPPPVIRISDLEAFIQEQVRQVGETRGILVEQIELSEIKPTDASVMRQWQELWHAYHRLMPDHILAEAKARGSTTTLLAFAGNRARIIEEMVSEVQRLANAGPDQAVPPAVTAALENLLKSGIFDAVLDTDEDSPFVKQKLLP